MVGAGGGGGGASNGTAATRPVAAAAQPVDMRSTLPQQSTQPM